MTIDVEMSKFYLVKHSTKKFAKDSLVVLISVINESFLVASLTDPLVREWISTCDLYPIALTEGAPQSRWRYSKERSMLGQQLFAKHCV